MKKAIIKKLYIWANTVLPPAVGGMVLSFYHKLPPELQSWVNVYALAGIALGVVSGLLTWGISKWQGIPIMEMQTWLKENDLYHGEIDGLPLDQTKAALARAIEDPEIEAPDSFKKAAAKVIRPMGGKIP